LASTRAEGAAAREPGAKPVQGGGGDPVELDVDHRGGWAGPSWTPPEPSQGSSSVAISSAPSLSTLATPGEAGEDVSGSSRFQRAPVRVGLEDLNGHPAADIVAQPPRRAAEAHAGGGGEAGQENHDCAHPGHRPGRRLGQQPAGRTKAPTRRVRRDMRRPAAAGGAGAGRIEATVPRSRPEHLGSADCSD
jgi:hypothetical protein